MIELRWQNLMKVFQFEENKSELSKLTKRYQENHRAYHNLEHIKTCLHHLDEYPETIEDRNIIELAIWYHDIIYNPYRKDNELKSAEAATFFLSSQNADDLMIQKVHDLIMSTLHSAKPNNVSEALIMDIDITILGSPKDEYEDYCVKIRKEYQWVPFPLYRMKRKEILTRFLQRERLYFTDYYYSKLEEKARLNISKEIDGLS